MPEDRPKTLTDLPGVTPSAANKLVEAGFATLEAVAVATPQELSAIAGIPLTTAQKIIRAARDALDIRFKTALDLKKERMNVRKITTGSRNLDELLGGGIETRIITEFYGPFGSGKCVSKDTPILYMNPDKVGLKSIAELYEKYAEIYGEERVDEGFAVKAPALKVLAFDGSGFRFARAPLIYRERARRILEIKTDRGTRIKLTRQHPLLILNHTGVSWVKAGGIEPGDYIARPRELPLDHVSVEEVSEDDAYFIGLFLAGGVDDPPSILVGDEGIIRWLKSYLNKRFGFKPRIQRNPSERRLPRVFLEKPAAEFLEPLVHAKPDEQSIPEEILRAPRRIIEHFLAGYLEGKGDYAGSTAMEIVAENRRLAAELAYLMARLGVKAVLRDKHAGGKSYHRIIVSGVDGRIMASLPFKSRKPRMRGAAEDDGDVPGIVVQHLREAYRKAFRGAWRRQARLSENKSGRAYRLLAGPHIRGCRYISMNLLSEMEDVFRRGLEELEKARSMVELDEDRFPEAYRRLPFPLRQVLAEKLGVSPSTIGSYLVRGLPKSREKRRRIVKALVEELEKRSEIIREALSLINTVKKLGWERVVSVREVDYNDYVYDVVVPGYHTFVGGEAPIIMHNTQLCHQLSVNVQLPPEKGGLQAKAAYVDAEGTFRWERIEAMARGVGLDPDKAMENILYVRAVNSDHQMAVVDELMSRIPEEGIKLVVVDSITGHFRAEYPGRENLASRQQKLNRHLHQLMKMAEIYDVAVVITNQVMARPDVFYGDPTQAVGGHVLYHAPGVRVQLRRSKGNKRIARMVDAPHLPEGETIFVITEQGIRDPEEE